MSQDLDGFHAIFPAKPAGMSDSIYSFHKENGHCARLLRGECKTPCESMGEDGGYSVDFDHIEARSRGGADSDWNLEPKCSSYNRWSKRQGDDEWFSKPSFFDEQISPICLRKNQNAYGYGLIKGVYKDIFACPSKSIQRSYILLAWMVGSGKSIGMASILHGINEVINKVGLARPRIYKVLWLVHQESLVRSIMDEVKNEPVKYGILQGTPNAAIIEKSTDWDCYTPSADYVFACTQSLWNTQTSSLDIEERRQKLSRFDAIVIDECHYGIERYVEILSLAPHALKFVMSATPMTDTGRLLSTVEDGGYRHLFRLFSVFGYRPARAEGLVKAISPWDEGITSGRYIPVTGGESEFVESGQIVNGETNTQLKYNHPRTNAIIRRAIDEAEQIKEYKSHVMIRCDSIIKLKSIIKSIKEAPHEYFPQGSRGWGVNGIYGGAKGVKISDLNHPWMIVKKKGELAESSARLLLAVNMGQFGLNNPYCSVVAWTDPNLSMIELVQRIGRAVRTIRNIPPQDQHVVLIFPDNEDVKKQLENAVNYILNMDEIVSQNFIALDQEPLHQTGLFTPGWLHSNLSSSNQFDVNEAHGLLLPDGLSRDDIEAIAKSLDESHPEKVAEQIQDYVDKLNSEEFKNKQFGLPESAEPFQFVFREECKTSFTYQEMEQYVRSNHAIEDVPEILAALERRDQAIIKLISQQLKLKHSRFHQASGRFFSVQSLLGIKKSDPVLNRDEDTYFGRLKMSFKNLYERSSKEDICQLNEILTKSLYRSCQRCFSMDSFKLEKYAHFEAQLSNAMCSPMVRSRVVNQARAFAISDLREKMPGHFALYVNQIAQFMDGANDKEAN